MFHVLAWSADALGNTANTEVAAVSDDVIEVRDSRYFPFQDLWLWGFYAGAATLQRARLFNASLRNIAQGHIRPVENSLLPPDDPNFRKYLPYPLRFHANEDIIFDATSGVAMTEQIDALAIFGTSRLPTPVPQGDILTVRATSTTTAVDTEWTTVSLTYEQSLPAGRYALVGSEVQS